MPRLALIKIMTKKIISIENLRPTQLTLGLEDVNKRALKMAQLDTEDLNKLLARKSIPHVVGPDNEIYIVDHHHLCRALWSIGRKNAVLGKELADWSDMEIKDFWKRMDKNGYCWAIDSDGHRRPYSAIPKHVRELTDNVWRSLARAVRGHAFSNEDTPFQEFIWGDYFRTFMSQRLLEQDFDLAKRVATSVAHLPEAEDLPGYKL
jgi:hypothetical protein